MSDGTSFFGDNGKRYAVVKKHINLYMVEFYNQEELITTSFYPTEQKAEAVASDYAFTGNQQQFLTE
jgi:hypothetical protein